MLVRWAEGQQRSGSMGATVASHNRFGAYLRARSVPVNPSTDRQVAVRNATRSLSIAWQNTLTEVQRSMWEAYAAMIFWVNKFGDSVNLTGLNHYVRSNVPRVMNAIARVDAAPILFNLATAELNLQVTASEATQQLTVDGDAGMDWIGEAAAWQWVSMGMPQNSGIKFFGGPYRMASSIPGAGPPPWPAVIDAPFPIAEGQRIWVRTRIGRGDGRLSEFAQVNFLCAA